MKVYFACSVVGGRQDEAIYQVIVQELLSHGHQVPTAALASSDVLVEENVVQPGVVYRRDVTWIEESDVLVAEVSTPSHGVGYEIGYALGLRKPVICLYREGVQVSKMILGNPDPKLQIFSYLTLEDAVQSLRDRLNGVQL